MPTLTSIEHHSNTSPLNSSDWNNLLVERGLDSSFVLANVKRITKDKATELLGYTAQSDGLLLHGHGEYYQFKPDVLHVPQKGNPAKYITPNNSHYGMLFPQHPSISNYWSDVEELKKHCWWIDGHPFIGVTEGLIKALAGCSKGLATAGIPGVTMWGKKDSKGNRRIHPELKSLIDAGIGVIIIFDSDVWVKKAVEQQLNSFKDALLDSGAVVRTLTGAWTEDKGKGMDDFINRKHGADEFKALASKAALLNKLESALNCFPENKPVDKPKKKAINSKELSLELLERFEDRYSYHQEHQTWREYNGKTWVGLTDLDFLKIVDESIESLGVLNAEVHHLKNVETFLRLKLLVKKWIPLPQSKFIPFDDCIYDIDNAAVIEHKPGYRLLNCLPYKFNPIATDDNIINLLQKHCPNICNWLNFAMDDNNLKIEKILAITNAIIKCEFSNLQMFVHLVGEPGAGKGTLIRLWQNMLGKDNYHSTNLKALNDVYASSAFIDKMMLCFPDERNKTSIADILLLTSGKDGINVRKMRKEPTSAPFTGSVVIASNSNVFVGDTTGKDRRYCSVHFNKPIPKAQRDDKIFIKFDAELPALMNIALSMDSVRVVELIKGINDTEIPENSYQNWLITIQENSIANFIEECIMFRPGEKNVIRTGDLKVKEDNVLYKVYVDSCERAGLKSVSKNRFKDDFVRQCKELGWNVEAGYQTGTNRAAVIGEIMIRTEDCFNDVPTHSQQLLAKVNGSLTAAITPQQEPPKEVEIKTPEVELPKEQQQEPPKEPPKRPLNNQPNKTTQPSNKSKPNNFHQKINIGVTVKAKDERYPDIYKVVGGDGREWQVEPANRPAKSNSDFKTFATNQLIIVDANGQPIT